MLISTDTVFTVAAAAFVAGLSVTGFSRTDLGDPTTGWSQDRKSVV